MGYSIDTDISDFGSGFNGASPLERQPHFSRVNPAVGFTVTPTRLAHPVRRLQPGEPRADGDRTGLRQSGRALRSAERFRKRSGSETGGRAHRRAGRAGRSCRPTSELERRHVPHGQPERHPVRRHRDECRIFRQCRQHPASRPRPVAGRQVGRLQLAPRLQLRRCHVSVDIRRQRQVEQHCGRERQHTCPARRSDTADSANTGRLVLDYDITTRSGMRGAT